MKKNNLNNSKKGKIIALLVLSAITITLYILSGYVFGETSIFNKAITGNDFVNSCYNKIPCILKTIQVVTDNSFD